MALRQPLADIQFISDFAAFCRSRGDEAYRYSAPCGCACAQFLVASGRAQRPVVWGYHWEDDDRREVWFNPSNKFQSPLADAIRFNPHNFSALADRLEALLVDAPTVERVK